MAESVARHAVGHRISITGEPERTVVGFPGAAPLVDKSVVQQELAKAGILFNGSMFISARHSDADLDHTITTFDAAVELLAAHDDARPLLEGEAVQPVFRTP
jgi:glutamate-1-semialdehyde aminotransferase